MSSQRLQQPPKPRRPQHEQTPRAGHGLGGTTQRVFIGRDTRGLVLGRAGN